MTIPETDTPQSQREQTLRLHWHGTACDSYQVRLVAHGRLSPDTSPMTSTLRARLARWASRRRPGAQSAAGPVPVKVRTLRPGMVIELRGSQQLYDMSTDPWRLLEAGSRLEVVAVDLLATGRTDRQPYDVTLRSESGGVVPLEVADGDTEVTVIQQPGDGRGE